MKHQGRTKLASLAVDAAPNQVVSDKLSSQLLNGAGVVLGGAIPASVALAEKLDAPVCSGYQHNDSFPGSHPLACGPLGYNGSKAAMELIAKADVVLALGTRLNAALASREAQVASQSVTTRIRPPIRTLVAKSPATSVSLATATFSPVSVVPM